MTIKTIHDFLVANKIRAVVVTDRIDSRVEIRTDLHDIWIVSGHFEELKPMGMKFIYRELTWWDLNWRLRKHKVVVELR